MSRTALPGEREGLLVGSRLQPSHGVAGKICYASRQPRISSENTAVFCLDPQILARSGYRRLETASRPVSVGKEVFWTVQYATMVDLLLEAERAGEAQTAFVKEHLADAFDLWLREQYLRGLTEEEEDALR